MEFPRRGGVGRSLGTSERKAGRKEKQSKPGPKPKKRNARAEAKKKGQAMREMKARIVERRAQDDHILGSPDPETGERAADGLKHSVLNPNGQPRTFEQNLVFLTLFCSLYERRAVTQEPYVPFHPYRTPPPCF